MKSTAEVGAAVTLILTSGAGFSSGCILTALAPNTQLSVATLFVFRAGLRMRSKAARGQWSLRTQEIMLVIVYICMQNCHMNISTQGPSNVISKTCGHLTIFPSPAEPPLASCQYLCCFALPFTQAASCVCVAAHTHKHET